MKPYNPREMEEDVVRFWKNKNIQQKARNLRKRKKPFYFIDGPPYATGSIHMGTAWNKIIKDVYLRFWRMRGFNVWDQPGYDTHGTPIELQVEKELKFKNKKDIENYGISKFIQKCREFATKYIDVMSEQFADLGVWMDWKNPYLTLKNDYIEGAWSTFKKAHGSGFLYKGGYPVHVCPRCETVVAYNEVDYTKLTDTSIYVKFPVKGEKNKFLVIWTTTPWTLPGNMGVMVHPRFKYVEVQLGNGEIWIIAKERFQELMEAIEAGYKVLREFPGKELEGMEYFAPLEKYIEFPNLKKAYKVILSERYVNLEEGTGLVHTAPGHGKEDFDEGTKHDLPLVCPVEISGLMTKEAGKYAGKRAREVDQEIVRDLEDLGLLVYKHPYTHDYPICWRCDTPLLMINVPQWFFRVTAIRKKLLQENKKVKWIPKWAGERFKDWLENLSDWPVSRQRYWGIPLPIWECECGEKEVIGSFSELKKKSGLKKEIDFHRPEIDNVKIKCKCGKEMTRVKDVLDVWFDSGVCTWASLGYPRKKGLFKKMWPSDFQTEGPDQFRGWWNSQMITSVLTFNRSPFRNILLHGFVLDAKGLKMSKSKGNVVTPKEVVDKYGRDVLRFYLVSSALWNDFYFNWEGVKDTSRLFNIFWNVYQFIDTYVPKKQVKKPELEMEDKWILSRLNSILDKGKEMEEYRVHRFAKEIEDFILNDFSRWYIKIVRGRVSPSYEGKDKKSAQYTLLEVMENLLRALAPVSPFITDYVYMDMFSGKSVHMCDWPKPNKKLIKKSLEKNMETVKKIFEAASSLRQDKKIKLRWPVDKMFIRIEKPLRNLEGVIKNICNVRGIVWVKRISGKTREFDGGKIALGKVLSDEKLIREFSRRVQVMRKKEKLHVRDKIKLFVKSSRGVEDILRERERDILKATGSGSLVLGEMESERGKFTFERDKIKVGFKKIR